MQPVYNSQCLNIIHFMNQSDIFTFPQIREWQYFETGQIFALEKKGNFTIKNGVMSRRARNILNLKAHLPIREAQVRKTKNPYKTY